MIKNILKKILHKEYKFLNRIEISKSALENNFKYLSSLESGVSVAPVLKSNAYGHGLVEVGKIVDKLNPPFICVDSLHEAYHLLKAGVKSKILIMGYFHPDNLKVKKLPFSYAVFDLETARIINEYQKNAEVHIKVDTGMHRLGVQVDELEKFLEKLKELRNLQVVGLMSHLASADNLQFNKQVEQFDKAKEIIKDNDFNIKWFHLSASNGLLNPKTRQIIREVSNLVRAGKAFYGLSPYGPNKNLQPALTFKSTIAQIKTIQKGEQVGYDGTFTANRAMKIGILAAGYNDGVDRRLSNIGFVKVKNKFCRILGRVSMNITVIDLTAIKNISVGEEVIIISSQPSDLNSINSCAMAVDTIAHELLVHLHPSTKRVIVK